jgi:hypothetical protein
MSYWIKNAGRHAMKTYELIRWLGVCAALAAFLAFGAQAVVAQPLPPLPVSPAEGSTIVTPAFSWEASVGAAKYEIEVGPQSDPSTVYWSARTVNLTLTPDDASTFTNSPLYWRARAIDSSNVAGSWSSKIGFTKAIPAPNLVSPADGSSSVVVPTFEWEGVLGAAYYKVELSASSTFVPMEATYTTYNTRTTPVHTIPHGTYYWRVSGVDADGHVGTPSTSRTFTKGIYAPVLVSPGVNASVTVPTLEWGAADGAAYYQVELSTSETFVPVVATYTTYNLRITPVAALALDTYYWRVSGVDAGGHVGDNNWRRLNLIAPPAATDNTPQLITPAHAETIVTDPTFTWSRVIGADHYRLVVSIHPDFSTTYDGVTTHYNSYTPAVATSPDAYPNGTYYWRVEARTSGGTVIATSAARSFTKQEPLPLIAPADGATGLSVDPTFQWSQIVGADQYRLIVSIHPNFSTTYSGVTTDYNSYTPDVATSPDAYPNGTYYWKVEARTKGGTVIATSAARSFTKQELLPLVAPADGAALASNPTFQWSQIVGANHYRLVVSTHPTFSTIYDGVNTDYCQYTPYSPAGKASYANGVYYWKVEARTSGGTPVTTSTARTFAIGVRKVYVPLVSR